LGFASRDRLRVARILLKTVITVFWLFVIAGVARLLALA
jgi:hypothetical protein